MKPVLFASVIFGWIFIMTGTGIAEDIQNGFGGIAWSTPLDLVKDCEKVENQEGIQYCIRRDREHTLLGEPAPGVLYGFYQDAFFAVLIQIENDEAYVLTKHRLVQRLSTPETSLDKDGVVTMLRWTQNNVYIELFNDQSQQGFRLAYYYLPIANKAFRKHKMPFPSKWSKIKLFPVKRGTESEAIRILQF